MRRSPCLLLLLVLLPSLVSADPAKGVVGENLLQRVFRSFNGNHESTLGKLYLARDIFNADPSLRKVPLALRSREIYKRFDQRPWISVEETTNIDTTILLRYSYTFSSETDSLETLRQIYNQINHQIKGDQGGLMFKGGFSLELPNGKRSDSEYRFRDVTITPQDFFVGKLYPARAKRSQVLDVNLYTHRMLFAEEADTEYHMQLFSRGTFIGVVEFTQSEMR